MKFKYKIKNSEGAIVDGVADAQDKFALAEMIKNQGGILIVASPVEKGPQMSLDGIISIFFGVPTSEKILFTRNLAAMISAGVSLSRALSILERQTQNVKFRGIINEIAQDINQGKSLSDSVKKFPEVFSSLFVSMVHAGEESGKLSQALGEVGANLEKADTLTKKIKGALIYPAIILSAIGIIAVLMFIFVIPQITQTFKELKLTLPLPTKIIIGTSDLFANHAFLTLVFLALMIVLSVILLRSRSGKRAIDFIVLHLPVIKTIVKEINSARTARTLSSLFSSGVDINQAIVITKDVVQNHYYKEVLETASAGIQKGFPLSAYFKERTDIYPIMVGEMMEVGEETGKLGDMLGDISVFYEAEVDQKTKDLSTIIEPVLMLIVGAAVGFFAIAMIMPIYSIANSV